jgi:hypothetical protein
MAYTKKFWEEQPFDPACVCGEYRSFIQGRLNKIMDLPYIFVIIAMNHKRNFTPRTEWLEKRDLTKETIRNAKTGNVMNFPDTLDDDTQMFLESLRKYILTSRWNKERLTNEEQKNTVTEPTFSFQEIREEVGENEEVVPEVENGTQSHDSNNATQQNKDLVTTADTSE